jgi:hypothetical protein
MDQELKAKWVEALRSGKYEQGVIHFESGGRFCCLGVLCTVRGLPTTTPGFIGNNWKGVDDVVDGEMQRTLWKMNDGGTPFPEIADYIEKNL